MIIAIDGPAGAGKSTVARCLAKKLCFIYLDTGAMYRALTLKALDQGIDFKDSRAISKMCEGTLLDISNNTDGTIKVMLDEDDVSEAIRSPRITQHVSDLAKIKQVREQMLQLQRKLGLAHDSVIDGRDIGTVVFPDADKKFYIDAQFLQRVERRFKELIESGKKITREAVEADLKNRDCIDSTRSFAPLKQADDAVYVDTTEMTIEEAVATLFKQIEFGDVP